MTIERKEVGNTREVSLFFPTGDLAVGSGCRRLKQVCLRQSKISGLIYISGTGTNGGHADVLRLHHSSGMKAFAEAILELYAIHEEEIKNPEIPY